MNEAIIASVNDNVKVNDKLIFLGDWSFGKQENVEILRNSLNVKEIIFIFGNHDKKIRRFYKHLFTETHSLYTDYFNKNLFVMCHYPIAEWEECHRGSIHTFGHTHGNREVGGKSMDVGWCIHRRPLSLDEVLEKMSEKPVLGHH